MKSLLTRLSPRWRVALVIVVVAFMAVVLALWLFGGGEPKTKAVQFTTSSRPAPTPAAIPTPRPQATQDATNCPPCSTATPCPPEPPLAAAPEEENADHKVISFLDKLAAEERQ